MTQPIKVKTFRMLETLSQEGTVLAGDCVPMEEQLNAWLEANINIKVVGMYPTTTFAPGKDGPILTTSVYLLYRENKQAYDQPFGYLPYTAPAQPGYGPGYTPGWPGPSWSTPGYVPGWPPVQAVQPIYGHRGGGVPPGMSAPPDAGGPCSLPPDDHPQ